MRFEASLSSSLRDAVAGLFRRDLEGGKKFFRVGTKAQLLSAEEVMEALEADGVILFEVDGEAGEIWAG